jgi:DNA helicase II / ATP-dependent DNA helicase PcrA
MKNSNISTVLLDIWCHLIYYRHKIHYTKEVTLDFETLLLEKYNFSMKPQQRDAVLNADGPIVAQAVPGSGKTTVVALRCAYLVMCCGIAAKNILILTFSRSTQKDIELRYREIFGQESLGGLRFTTMHSFCNLVLREYGSLVGCKSPKLIDEGKRRLLRSLYAELNEGEYLPDGRLEELVNSISCVKNNILTGQQIEESNFTTRNFYRIYTAYEEYKNANSCMDYDDMQVRALAAFADKPDLLERFRNQYRYINVDEAQDTSKLQHAILQMLAGPRNNLFMAGDEDESIDIFRAADPEYMHEFSQAYPDAKIVVMERNYRSTHAIVDAANRVIKNNPSQHRVTMNTGNEIGMPLEETNLSDNSMLYGHLVARLKNEPDFGGSAVLYRDATSAVALMDVLDREGIPFSIREQKLSFFDHWVVRHSCFYDIGA